MITTAGSDEIALENIVDKKPVRTKEAVHFGFPFNLILKISLSMPGMAT
jgi:hypothetical protein